MTEIVNNILTALGAVEEGPDPTRLNGLLEAAGQFLEEGRTDKAELRGYFESMRSRIREAANEREGAMESRRTQLAPALVELLERNVSACQSVEEHLTAFLDGFALDSNEGCWKALEDLEGSCEEFRETSEQLAHMATSVPVCPRCGSTGPEELCASCDTDRLIPDPELQHEEFMQAPVPEEFLQVFEAYTAVLQGEGNLAALQDALQPLEFSLLEAQALAEQALDEDPDDSVQQDLVLAVENALAAVERMNNVRENRRTAELNKGWLDLFKGSVELGQLLARMSQGPSAAADEEEGDSEEEAPAPEEPTEE